MGRIKILVVSRSETVAEAVAAKLKPHSGYSVRSRVVANGHTDPLHGVLPRPDLMLLHYQPGSAELEHLAAAGAENRVPLIVFGPATDPDAMRLAMRAGASDYLPEPLDEDDLFKSLDHASSALAQQQGKPGKLFALLSSKGGSGSSFIACNVGCVMAGNGKKRAALLDFDLDFGSLARYLDLSPERGLLEAADALHELDQASAEAFLAKHKCGVKLLAAPAGRLSRHLEVLPEHIDGLCQIFLQHHDFVVADVSNDLNGPGPVVLERADEIVLVVQQTLAYLDGAVRLIDMMKRDCAVEPERISVVVNRFVKNAPIELEDIRKALKVEAIYTVPNHFQMVNESLDTGKPVVVHSSGSNVSKAIRELASGITGEDLDDSGGRSLLRRTLPNFLGAN